MVVLLPEQLFCSYHQVPARGWQVCWRGDRLQRGEAIRGREGRGREGGGGGGEREGGWGEEEIRSIKSTTLNNTPLQSPLLSVLASHLHIP